MDLHVLSKFLHAPNPLANSRADPVRPEKRSETANFHPMVACPTVRNDQ